jgi:hypothetical protein
LGQADPMFDFSLIVSSIAFRDQDNRVIIRLSDNVDMHGALRLQGMVDLKG